MTKQIKPTILGFSLIETLVSMGIFALLVGGITSLFIMVVKNNGKAEILLNLRQEGNNAILKINRLVTPAMGSSCSADQHTLTVQNLDETVTSITCTISDPDPKNNIVAINGVNVFSTDTMGLSACSFTCLADGKTVDLSFELGNTNSSDSLNFQTKMVLRNAK